MGMPMTVQRLQPLCGIVVTVVLLIPSMPSRADEKAPPVQAPSPLDEQAEPAT